MEKTDIVKRLRDNQLWLHRDGFRTSADNARDAMGEIKTLRAKVQEQAAEIEVLNLALENSGNRHTYEAPEGMCFMPYNTLEQITELTRQRDEAMQDAERYRWLLENGSANSKLRSKAIVYTDETRTKALLHFSYWCEVTKVSEAIDAARSKS